MKTYKFDVTVVIPVFNASKYLEKCIKSIENQENISLEIIAIDDYSSDNSYDKLLELQSKSELRNNNSFLILKNEENKGTAATLDMGFNAAQGKYVAVVDADDFLALHALSNCFIYMEQYQEIDYLWTLYESFDVNERVFRRGNRCKKPAPITQKELILANLEHFSVFHMKFIRAESYFNKMIPWREMPKSAVDYAFVLRNMFYVTFKRLDFVAYYYRSHTPGGHSTKNKKVQSKIAKEERDKALHYALEKNYISQEEANNLQNKIKEKIALNKKRREEHELKIKKSKERREMLQRKNRKESIEKELISHDVS